MKMRVLRDLNAQQLTNQLRELRQELFNLRFQFATRQLTNTARIRQVRRDIARVLTRLRQIELEASTGAGK
jgi:large subunit ribosomal protein L29